MKAQYIDLFFPSLFSTPDPLAGSFPPPSHDYKAVNYFLMFNHVLSAFSSNTLFNAAFFSYTSLLHSSSPYNGRLLGSTLLDYSDLFFKLPEFPPVPRFSPFGYHATCQPCFFPFFRISKEPCPDGEFPFPSRNEGNKTDGLFYVTPRRLSDSFPPFGVFLYLPAVPPINVDGSTTSFLSRITCPWGRFPCLPPLTNLVFFPFFFFFRPTSP